MLYRTKKPICMMTKKEVSLATKYHDLLSSLSFEDWRDVSCIQRRMYNRLEKHPKCPLSPSPTLVTPTLHTLHELGIVEIYGKDEQVQSSDSTKPPTKTKYYRDLENLVMSTSRLLITLSEAVNELAQANQEVLEEVETLKSKSL